MLTLDLKSRMKNKTFWVAIISAIVLLIQQLGFKYLIPQNWSDIVNTTLSILVMLGIVVDTSTPGISDKTISPSEQGVIITDKGLVTSGKIEIKEDSNTINVQATDNLNASSKITVDVPQE